MTGSETMLWSAEAGSVGLIVLLALADALYSRSRGAVNTLAYLAGCWVFIVILCGLPAAVLPSLEQSWLRSAEVLIGPLCAGLGSYGIGLWLSAHKRDRLTKNCLRATSAVCLTGGPLCLLLPGEAALVASAALTISSLSLSVWLSARAALQGDRLAWGMAAGSLLALPLQLGLYAIALWPTNPQLPWQAGTALSGIASLGVTATVLWLRNRHERQIMQDGHSRRDPVTQLYSSVVIVQKIINAQQRRVRMRGDGAVMAVMLFDPERLQAEVGQYGMNEIYTQLARRMQRHTGVVNPAGRYYDRCFIVLMETMHSPKWIRTMGLRVASSLRQPLEVTSLGGDRIRLTADIGVGITHLSRAPKDVDQLLHEAQDLAQAARAMRSRAALMDHATRRPIPVESAELGNTWRAPKPRKTATGTAKKPVAHAARAGAGIKRRGKLA